MVDVVADLRDGHAEAVRRRHAVDDALALLALEVVEKRLPDAVLLDADNEPPAEVRRRGVFAVRRKEDGAL